MSPYDHLAGNILIIIAAPFVLATLAVAAWCALIEIRAWRRRAATRLAVETLIAEARREFTDRGQG